MHVAFLLMTSGAFYLVIDRAVAPPSTDIKWLMDSPCNTIAIDCLTTAATAAGKSRAENPHFHPFPGAWLPINSILGHAHKNIVK